MYNHTGLLGNFMFKTHFTDFHAVQTRKFPNPKFEEKYVIYIVLNGVGGNWSVQNIILRLYFVPRCVIFDRYSPIIAMHMGHRRLMGS